MNCKTPLVPVTAALALSLLACGKGDSEHKTAESDLRPNLVPASTDAGQDCQEEKAAAMFATWEASALAYSGIAVPAATVDCEALRVFMIELQPLAQEFTKQSMALKGWSQQQSKQCREQRKEKYGARLSEIGQKLQASTGQHLDKLEARVRECKDHPGMVEAFKGASFPVADDSAEKVGAPDATAR